MLRYEPIREALRGERLPCALVDLEALEANAARLVARLREAAPHKSLRLASKSIRCVALLRRLLELGGADVRGLMTYSAAETEFLAREGLDDFVLAYPTLQRADLDGLAELCAEGRRVHATVDCEGQAEALGRAALEHGTVVPVLLDIDLGYRPLGRRLHLGVRRSPVRTPGQALELARRLRETPGVRVAGLLAYEAQIAGLTDRNPFTRAANPFKRLLKRLSRPELARRRQAVVEALAADGFELGLVNGGGTGSLRWTAAEPAVTEVTAGSGFYCPHLFDYYAGLELEPAAFFALQTVRACPQEGYVTCHGGGYVASGEAGADRLPRPWLPPGLQLLPLEGAGEVQTPLRATRGAALPALGDPVVFRHAKAGELAEHFAELLLVREDRVVERVPTYRGAGQAFL